MKQFYWKTINNYKRNKFSLRLKINLKSQLKINLKSQLLK